MKLEKIIWHFYLPDKNCECSVCNQKQAELIAYIGDWRPPVCADCGQKTETEILRAIGAV